MLIKKVLMDKANRLYQMPPSLLAFAETRDKQILRSRASIIDLASFDWPVSFSNDQELGLDSLKAASAEQINHLKEELSVWLSKRHGCKTISVNEIHIGGRVSALLHQLALAYLDTGDVAFVPGLGIPLYRTVVTACDAEAIGYAISARNEWLPSYDRLSTRLGRVARLLFLNSPHNPTGAQLTEKEMTELAWMAGRENVLLVNDAAYAGIPKRAPVSLLSVKGGRRVGVDLYSFSYLLGLPPLPFGFAVGGKDVIGGLKTAARLMPTYIPKLFVELALEGLRPSPEESISPVRDTITKTSAKAEGLLELLGLKSMGYGEIPFLWAKTEKRSSSVNLARLLLRRYRILTVPGTAFGENGAGFLRFSLLTGPEVYTEAEKRVGKRSVLRPKVKK
ncbi:MAG: hypothetical protein DRP45_03175 [Candidatus Zixiibacteriota bacterium]|nr:MAG: hypothetical protein DRP45_03175 [candidate division Zixibacteria bacterium]